MKREAYRGYLILETLHGFSISKSGAHIAWAESLEGVRIIIDELV